MGRWPSWPSHGSVGFGAPRCECLLSSLGRELSTALECRTDSDHDDLCNNKKHLFSNILGLKSNTKKGS